MLQSKCHMYTIDGTKFKTNAYVLFFRVALTRKCVTKLALLAEILKNQHIEQYQQAEELYGALWDINVIQKGGEGWLLFSVDVAKCIAQQDVIDFFMNWFKQQKFSVEVVQRSKEILEKKLQAQRDDKRSYALARCRMQTAKHNPCGLCANGYLEDIQLIDVAQINEFYQYILTQVPIYFFYCGEPEGKQALLSWKTQTEFAKGNIPFIKEIPLPETTQLQVIKEQAQMQQTRIVLGFVTEISFASQEMLSLQILCEILGGSGNGLFFQKLREQQGLCYDITMNYDTISGMAFIQTGVERNNVKKAVNSICSIIDDVIENGVSDTQFDDALHQLICKYEKLSDNPWQILDFVSEQTVYETNFDNAEYIHILRHIQKKQIQQIAKKLNLQIVYILQEQEETV